MKTTCLQAESERCFRERQNRTPQRQQNLFLTIFDSLGGKQTVGDIYVRDSLEKERPYISEKYEFKKIIKKTG